MTGGTLAADKNGELWEHVARTIDSDIDGLSRDLIDPAVSDADLESRRLAFSGKFLDSIRDGLDKIASRQLASGLLDQLHGNAGKAMADAYRESIKRNVGDALEREWRGAADGDRAAADQNVRNIRAALNSARSVVDKAATILEQVKDQAGRAAQDAGAPADSVRQALECRPGQAQGSSVCCLGAESDLDKARPEAIGQVPDFARRLGEIDTSFDKFSGGLSEADKAGTAGQPTLFSNRVADARHQVDQLQQAIQRAAAGLDHEAEQANSRFVKAAEEATSGSAGMPGVKSRIEQRFKGAFRRMPFHH